jgi:DNA-directed RNA polymerase subunit M/transcription elongation factor TFIIS
MTDFCPKCKSILLVKSDSDTSQLLLACINCDYVRNASGENRTLRRTTIAKDINRESINPAMLYDRALIQTTWIKCPNGSCPTIDPTNWDTTLPSSGLKVFPSVMITNFTNADKVATYICKTCNAGFRARTAVP